MNNIEDKLRENLGNEAKENEANTLSKNAIEKKGCGR
jgi:hypothetical protein